MTMEALNFFELGLLQGLQEAVGCPLLDKLTVAISLTGDKGISLITLALVLLCIPKTRKAGAMMGLAMIFGLLVGNLTLKPLIARERPYTELGIAPYLVEALSSKSFPSGHTLVCFEAATVLMLRYRKPWGIAALVVAFLVAFSRMYLYVHFPTDVIAGIILGTFFGFLGVWIINAVVTAWQKRRKS
jgi:undecaprenyl-diphosphatase